MAQATIAQIRSAQLIDVLWNDPEVGGKIRSTAKSMWPDVLVDIKSFSSDVSPVRIEIDAIKKRLAELEAKIYAGVQSEDRKVA